MMIVRIGTEIQTQAISYTETYSNVSTSDKSYQKKMDTG